MEKYLDIINRFLPRGAKRRAIARTLYEKALKLKTHPQFCSVLCCERAELKNGKLYVKGWLATNGKNDSIGYQINGGAPGLAKAGISRPEISDIFFFVKNWICAGFEFEGQVPPKTKISSLKITHQEGKSGVSLAINLGAGPLSMETATGQDYNKILKKMSSANPEIKDYIEKHKLEKIEKYIALLVISQFDKTRPVLFFNHNLGGGAESYAQKKLASKFDKGEKILSCKYDKAENLSMLKLQSGNFAATLTGAPQLEILKALKLFQFKEIFVNSLVSFPKPRQIAYTIKEIKKKSHSRITIPIHDYYPVCPSFNLINDKGAYCGIPDLDECERCMAANKQEEIFTKPDTMYGWREYWGEVLAIADEILCFSKSSISLIMRAYPNLNRSKIKFRPHQVESWEEINLPRGKTPGIKIGIIGRLNYPKGSRIVKDMAKLIDTGLYGDIKIIHFGDLLDLNINSPAYECTGKYKHSELPGLIKKHKPDLIFIPSICPETFSFSTAEAKQTGLPVATFKIGAQAERIQDYTGAILINEIGAKSAMDEIIKLFRNSA